MRPSDQQCPSDLISPSLVWDKWSLRARVEFHTHGAAPSRLRLVRVPSRGPGRLVCLCSACSARAVCQGSSLEPRGWNSANPQTPLGLWQAPGWGWLLHPSPMTRRTCTAGGAGTAGGGGG